MEGSGSRPAQGDPGMASEDWRSELPLGARQRIANKIMETLKKYLPTSDPQGLFELHRIAVRFEEKVHAAATSQPDYLRKISIKMLTMEASRMDRLASNSATGIQISQVPGQGHQQNASVCHAQNVARAFEIISSPQQHQKQPKRQKRSCSHAMGKGKKCRTSCAVKEEILCSICLDPVMDNGERSIAKLQCSHQFHLDCIGSAFNAKASMQCPTCRRVENGQWRFADKHHAFSDFDEDDWAYSDIGEDGQSGYDPHDD
ncbi:unnamed protein product [Victoria cruziana]